MSLLTVPYFINMSKVSLGIYDHRTIKMSAQLLYDKILISVETIAIVTIP